MSWIEDVSYRTAVPTLQAVDFGDVTLSPEEGFILSRVDGSSTVEEICLVTGLPEGTTLEALAKLHQSALIQIPGAPAAPTTDPRPDPLPEASDDGGPDEALAEPFVLEEDVELSEKKQRELHSLFLLLEQLDFYDLLGLERGCSGNDVQRAYRKISLKFHPDRFYGKNLGSYKVKLEAIFRHISNVAEYLTDDEERAAYEAALGPDEPEPEPVTSEVPRAGSDSPSGLRPRVMSKKDKLRRLGGALGMSTKELRAVARKKKPKPGALRTEKAPDISADRKARLRQDRKQRTRTLLTPLMQRREKAQKHYDEGIRQLLEGNFPAAASNLKLATTFDPKNEVYREKEMIASGRAREGSAVAYSKRAAFEESVGHWGEASRLYCMAVERNPTVENYCKAADSLVKTDDLKRAVEYATKAKDLDPNSVQARLSLAKAYLTAGMPKNARREVEFALKLDSDNRIAKALLKEAKRAE